MIQTRPAIATDEAFLLALTRRLTDFPVPPWRTRGEIACADHRILLEALRGDGGESVILVAVEAAGERLGYVFATTRTDYFTGQRNAHVEVLAVGAESEGKGVARILLAAVDEWARGAGCSTVTLNVFAANAKARGLYEHLGYQPELLSYRRGL